MSKIIIKEAIGQRCIIGEDGQKIYNSIYQELKNGRQVVLDFEGVSQFASPFFNYGIGQLLKDITESQLNSLLKIENLNEIGQQIVRQVIENASKYHVDKNYREVVDNILASQTKESN